MPFSISSALSVRALAPPLSSVAPHSDLATPYQLSASQPPRLIWPKRCGERKILDEFKDAKVGKKGEQNGVALSILADRSHVRINNKKVDEDEVYWRHKKASDELAWSHNSAHVGAPLARCFANAMVGPRSWIGGIFSRSGNRRYGSGKFMECSLSPLQEQRLQQLQERLQIPFDETRADHQEALRDLWFAAFPNIALKGLISEQWKDMGWQGPNPSTDFRGCGFISLENLLFFARNYPAAFHRLLFKKGGKRATWEYPFAVAGINVSFMLIQMLDLCLAKPRCLPGINFVRLLGDDEEAFDVLYCIAFAMMDAQWLAMRASYMEFNEVLRVTRTQLERELSLEDVNRIQDLPAYNLLYY